MRTLALTLALLAGLAADAHAAPLKVYSHQANLYGGKLMVSRVYVDVTVTHQTKATVYVNGLNVPYRDYTPQEGARPHELTVRLHEGRNRWGRTFFLRCWRPVIVPIADDRFVAGRVAGVYADLKIGNRRWEAR